MLFVQGILCGCDAVENVFTETTYDTAARFIEGRNYKSNYSEIYRPSGGLKAILPDFEEDLCVKVLRLRSKMLSCKSSEPQIHKVLELARHRIPMFNVCENDEYKNIAIFYLPLTDTLYKKMIWLFYCALNRHCNKDKQSLGDLKDVLICLNLMCTHFKLHQQWLSTCTPNLGRYNPPFKIFGWPGNALQLEQQDKTILDLASMVLRANRGLTRKTRRMRNIICNNIRDSTLREHLEDLINIFAKNERFHDMFVVRLILSVLRRASGFNTAASSFEANFCNGENSRENPAFKRQCVSMISDIDRKAGLVIKNLEYILRLPLRHKNDQILREQFKENFDALVIKVNDALVQVETQDMEKKDLEARSQSLAAGISTGEQLVLRIHKMKVKFLVERFFFYQDLFASYKGSAELVFQKVSKFIQEQYTEQTNACNRVLCPCINALMPAVAQSSH